jgi:hypothetical protein
MQMDAMDSDEEAAALHRPPQDVRNSSSAVADGVGTDVHSQLRASNAVPLLWRAGQLQPQSSDFGRYYSAKSMAPAVAAAAGKQQQHDIATAAEPLHTMHGASSSAGDSRTSKGRDSRRNKSSDQIQLTELQAQVGTGIGMNSVPSAAAAALPASASSIRTLRHN